MNIHPFSKLLILAGILEPIPGDSGHKTGKNLDSGARHTLDNLDIQTIQPLDLGRKPESLEEIPKPQSEVGIKFFTLEVQVKCTNH